MCSQTQHDGVQRKRDGRAKNVTGAECESSGYDGQTRRIQERSRLLVRPKRKSCPLLPRPPHPHQTQNAPLAQRIQFLEAKGLSAAEIDQAVRFAANQPLPVYQPAPHHHQWDWRDYFVRIHASRCFAHPHLFRSRPWCLAQ